MFHSNKAEFLRRFITMDETWVHHLPILSYCKLSLLSERRMAETTGYLPILRGGSGSSPAEKRRLVFCVLSRPFLSFPFLPHVRITSTWCGGSVVLQLLRIRYRSVDRLSDPLTHILISIFGGSPNHRQIIGYPDAARLPRLHELCLGVRRRIVLYSLL